MAVFPNCGIVNVAPLSSLLIHSPAPQENRHTRFSHYRDSLRNAASRAAAQEEENAESFPRHECHGVLVDQPPESLLTACYVRTEDSLANADHTPPIPAVSSRAKGSSDQKPRCWRMLPASQGKKEAPTLPRQARKPTAPGSWRGGTIWEAKAIIVG